MSVSSELAEQVKARAADRCEYCCMHQSLQGGTFHIEHIVPQSRGGLTTLENLALACAACNLHKSDRILARDPETATDVAFFNPRVDVWSDHFVWDGYRVSAVTATGRATIDALELNHPRKLLIRQAEEMFGLFPPS